MARNVAVLIRDRERQYEGLRVSIGLLLEAHHVAMFVLSHEIELGEDYMENLEFIDEMGGARFSDVDKNVSEHGFQPVALADVAGKITAYDIVVPF